MHISDVQLAFFSRYIFVRSTINANWYEYDCSLLLLIFFSFHFHYFSEALFTCSLLFDLRREHLRRGVDHTHALPDVYLHQGWGTVYGGRAGI